MRREFLRVLREAKSVGLYENLISARKRLELVIPIVLLIHLRQFMPSKMHNGRNHVNYC